MVSGLRCVVCGEEIEISRACSWICGQATESDPFHVLEFVDDGAEPSIPIDSGELNPFVRYRERMGWWAFARSNGMSDAETVEVARGVAGQFAVTPLERPRRFKRVTRADGLGKERNRWSKWFA